MFNAPIIRLELESMKQTMQIALADYHMKVSEEVELQLSQLIETFPFEKMVQEAAYDALTDAIVSYFKYGDGYKFIQKAVQDAFDQTIGKIKE